jgi:tetratricopeptide (TPR) repeat protein
VKRKRSNQRVSPLGRLRPYWPWFLGGGILVAGLVLFLLSSVHPLPPPPPVVNTTGFDSVIATAIVDAREGALRSPRSAEARGRMGMVLLAHQVRAEAGMCFAQAAALAPREPRWPYFLGLAQLLDSPMAAVTNLDRAVQLFPDRESAPRLKLADTLLSLGRVDEAELHYQQVRQHESNSAPAALGLGKVANARDHSSDAANLLAAATQSPFTRRAAHRLLLNVNQRLGRTNEAEQVANILAGLPNDLPLPDPFFAQVEQLKTGEQVWMDQADDWMKGGRVADAARVLEKTIETYPKSDRAMFLLGRARLRLGDPAGAEAILMRAIALAPGSVEAQLQLGVTRLSQGRSKAAQPCFRAAIQAKPNLGEAWYNLGLSLGNDVTSRAESIAAFREAIRLKPNLIEAYLGLAIVLRMDGQNRAAADEMRRALDLQPAEPLRQKLLDQLKLTGQP